MKKAKEIPIDGTGMVHGMRVMAKKYLLENSCDDCCFISLRAGYHLSCPFDKCNGRMREDKTHVYFIEVKK